MPEAWGNAFQAGRITGQLCVKGRAMVKMEDGEFRLVYAELAPRRRWLAGWKKDTTLIALHDVETIILGRLADE